MIPPPPSPQSEVVVTRTHSIADGEGCYTLTSVEGERFFLPTLYHLRNYRMGLIPHTIAKAGRRPVRSVEARENSYNFGGFSTPQLR